LQLATTQSNHTTDAIHQAHEQFSEALRRQAGQIDQLMQGLESLRNEQQQLEDVASHMIEPLTRSLDSDAVASALSPSGILACVRKLAVATDVEQIFEALAEEAGRMSVRAAVLSVRGRVAWGSSAGGFGPEFSSRDLRTLVVPLNHDGPFRQVFEMAVAMEVRSIDLLKIPNVFLKFAPASNARVVLLPVRSAGSVAAILYVETGEKRDLGLIDSLKLLAEFAGAQIDRLTIIHGGLAAGEPTPASEEAGRCSEQAVGDKIRVAEQEATASAELPKYMALDNVSAASPTPTPEAAPLLAHNEAPTEPSASPSETVPVKTPETASTEPPASPSEPVPVMADSPEAPQLAEQPQAAVEEQNAALSAEQEEKIHRDARRFSKLLVSEIKLYNTNSVEEGRRNKDLYQRLKKDIDRSRETYEKRFADTVASKVDYFHEELVRTLAENDPTLLGSDYPGPSV
jgi:hypothetical protein